MSRYLFLWMAQARYMLAREMMFRATFLMWIVVDLAWFALNLSFVEFLFLHTESVAGWSKWEMVLLFSTSNLIQYLFQGLCMVSCMNLPELVRTGKLDFVLAQPADTQFLVSTRNFDPGSLTNSLTATAVIAWALHHLPGGLSMAGVALACLMIPFGLLLHYGVMFPLVTLSFWMTKAQGIVSAYYQAFQIARMPREIFPRLFGTFFSWVLPLSLVANVPARALTSGRLSSWAWVLAGVSVLLVLLGRRFFFLALRRYTSASS
jgi:ABC-2 type transport system permease protein